jgi:hypothetical protein
MNTICTGCGGAVLDRILQQFDVTALELAHFSRHAAADFLEVYQGISPDFFVLLLTLLFYHCYLINSLDNNWVLTNVSFNPTARYIDNTMHGSR